VESFDGRADLVVAPGEGDGPPVVVSAELPLAPGGGHGGGTWCWAGDDEVVVAGVDGSLAVLGAAGGVRRVLVRDGRAFAPFVSARGEVACSIERDDSCDIGVVPLDGSEWPVRVSRGADYAWDPAWSHDGRLLAWHEWDLPAMPWEGSRIVVRDHDAGTVQVVAGGDRESVGQPRFSPDGTALAYITDESGWANVWVAKRDGSDARAVLSERSEHAEPSWGPGQRSFAWAPGGEQLAWCRNERGFGRLVIGAPGRRSARDLSKGWHHGLDWGARGIVAVRSGARTPSTLVVLAPDGSARRDLVRGPVGGFDERELAEPRAVTWKSASALVHGLLYAPARSAPGAERRAPLLVLVHGGPTGQATVSWQAEIAFWLSRGWAVLRPNPRGSTGYGRAYAQALAGRWGERDVADVIAGIRAAVREGWCDGARVAIRGGSSGGFVALLVAARAPELVRAVVSESGVTDLFELAATTHRFESRYTDWLVGELPRHADRYRDRSPITHAAAIRAPVLVLHGTDDNVVLPAQADALVAALERAGTVVERHSYDGAGHGLRRAPHIADALGRIDAFLTSWVLRR
jgi:dipeptidyl aminopeptidase/acylaminoacyl peptidase